MTAFDFGQVHCGQARSEKEREKNGKGTGKREGKNNN
jgi:hypothetical protein